MRNTIVALTLFVLAGAAMPASTRAAAAEAARSHSPWNDKMQELYRTLADLLTDVSSDRRFNNPANRSRIENEAKKLASAAHDLTRKDMISPDADPTISIISAILGRETKRAVQELRQGNSGYARSILRGIPSYCIACHTKNSRGSQFSKLPLEPSSGSLTPLELGEFYAASRQFDRAQEQFKKVVTGPVSSTDYNSWDWEKAIQQSLAIAVRVKQDPKQAKEIVQVLLDSPGTPPFMRENAKAWTASLDEWLAEKSPAPTSPEAIHTQALHLMEQARAAQKYPMDRAADILYLRASAAAHDLLQVAPKGATAAEGLLLAGLAYEVLSPLRLEDLHEIYYAACINEAPHTPTAELCYGRYEEALFFAYTGSAGIDIPSDVRSRLTELRELSQQQGAKTNP